MIDFHNRKDILERLGRLKPDTPPVFGKMSAQHMVEHLALVMQYSNGKKFIENLHPARSAKWKEIMIYTDREMTIGIRAPFIGEEPLPLINLDLPTAIK